jgi:hypothetical protein
MSHKRVNCLDKNLARP